MAKYYFKYNKRLGIEIPIFNISWEELNQDEQKQILYRWEHVRSGIPDRIKELETEIHKRELQLQIEDNFQTFCQLSEEIADMASKVIDLNLWFRTHEDITPEKVHQ